MPKRVVIKKKMVLLLYKGHKGGKYNNPPFKLTNKQTNHKVRKVIKQLVFVAFFTSNYSRTGVWESLLEVNSFSYEHAHFVCSFIQM